MFFQIGDQEIGSGKSMGFGLKLGSKSQLCLLLVVQPQETHTDEETHTQLPHLQNESSQNFYENSMK